MKGCCTLIMSRSCGLSVTPQALVTLARGTIFKTVKRQDMTLSPHYYGMWSTTVHHHTPGVFYQKRLSTKTLYRAKHARENAVALAAIDAINLLLFFGGELSIFTITLPLWKCQRTRRQQSNGTYSSPLRVSSGGLPLRTFHTMRMSIINQKQRMT